MLKVTAGAYHEKLSFEGDTIILNGPPDDLRGHMLIHNALAEPLAVRSLPLLLKTKDRSKPVSSSLRVSCRLQPGESQLTEISHQLRFDTPPGTYEHELIVGGKKRMVQLIVQQNIAIDLYPREFYFTGSAPGTVHTATFTVINTGNIPFNIPEVKHIAALDMDFFCRAFGMGMRKSGSEGVEKMLDEVTRNMQHHLTEWAAASIEEKGMELKPGEKSVINLRITMPAKSDGSKDYSGNIRFWDKDIHYVVKA